MAGLSDDDGSHLGRRGARDDQAEGHHRIAAIPAAGAGLGPGLPALEVAGRVGAAGRVLGIDLSDGMLAEANRKAAAAGLRNVDVALADAERLELPAAGFDRVFCASALVLMPDARRALRHRLDLLRPGGTVAFDVPAGPFGMSGTVADVAARHGIRPGHADMADTPAKCRALLEEAGCEVEAVSTELANAAPIERDAAVAFWDDHLDHPAWRALRAAAVAGHLRNDAALNFAFGRRPS